MDMGQSEEHPSVIVPAHAQHGTALHSPGAHRSAAGKDQKHSHRLLERESFSGAGTWGRVSLTSSCLLFCQHLWCQGTQAPVEINHGRSVGRDIIVTVGHHGLSAGLTLGSESLYSRNFFDVQ